LPAVLNGRPRWPGQRLVPQPQQEQRLVPQPQQEQRQEFLSYPPEPKRQPEQTPERLQRRVEPPGSPVPHWVALR